MATFVNQQEANRDLNRCDIEKAHALDGEACDELRHEYIFFIFEFMDFLA